MTEFFKSVRSKKLGLPPGSLVFLEEEKKSPVRITIFNFNPQRLEEKMCTRVDECLYDTKDDSIIWINIDGLQDVKVIETLCNHYGVHPLTIEDILTPGQRPKIEDRGDYIFVVLRTLDFNEDKVEIDTEQVSFILGDGYVISIQEREGDTFDPIRNRLRIDKGRARNSKSDYLLYGLIDTIVDNYFVILEKIGDDLEEIEEKILKNATKEAFDSLYILKTEMITLRKSVWPLRDVIYRLEREDLRFVHKETKLFLRDVYDHTIQVIDTIESYRDMLSSMVDLYQTAMSNKMNAVMKVLTVISTIFIPLNFIAGVYGMNFEEMPELNNPYGYYYVLSFMFLVLVGMLFYFKKKDWI